MITVEQLSFTYPRTQTAALSELTFEVQRGEIFGLLGPSGAGKSTTQKILIGLLSGYRGKVSVDGHDLRSLGSRYYERIGVAFELPNHFQRLSALENLRYFAAFYQRPVRNPLELLAEFGLEADAKTPVEQFSKGMQMRLSLARALQHDPELLFLDEPTSGLDPLNARRVREVIAAQRAQGKTVVLTTHNMALANELCDRVAFLIDGQIALIDAPRALSLRFGQPLVRVEYLNGGSVTQSRDFALSELAGSGEFQALLQSNTLQTIHSREASLEDIFIQVTGRSLI